MINDCQLSRAQMFHFNKACLLFCCLHLYTHISTWPWAAKNWLILVASAWDFTTYETLFEQRGTEGTTKEIEQILRLGLLLLHSGFESTIFKKKIVHEKMKKTPSKIAHNLPFSFCTAHMAKNWKSISKLGWGTLCYIYFLEGTPPSE